MFCPDCAAEFREGITVCADCDVALTPEPPPEPTVEPYETVLETSEVSVIPVIKTALEAAGIPFRTRGEGLMNIFPSEALGAVMHSAAGEVRIRVPVSRAEEARRLLEKGAEETDEQTTDEQATEEASEQGTEEQAAS